MTKICAYEPCSKEFEPKTHNQIYHSDQCTKLATNERIMAKYYETKARKKGEVRVCKCGTLLSRYNPDKICAKCVAEEKEKQKQKIVDMLDFL